MRLKDKVAIITGGASGIGRAIALGYAKEGADVVVVDIDKTGAVETVREVLQEGRKAEAFFVDVSDQKQVNDMVDRVIEKFGKVDILVNSAAILEPVSLLETTVEQWDRTMNVNLKGVFFCVQAVCRFMSEHGGGKIINITSNASIRGRAKQHAYSASKGGLRGLTGNVAVQMGEYGIHINNISAGWIDTNFPESLKDDPAYREYRIAATPLLRIGQPEDIVGPAIFLASSEADFITGETLVVDGGASVELSGIGGHIKSDY